MLGVCLFIWQVPPKGGMQAKPGISRGVAWWSGLPVPYLSGVDLEALPFVGSAHLIVDALRAMPHQLTNSVGLSMPPVPPFDPNPNPNLTPAAASPS